MVNAIKNLVDSDVDLSADYIDVRDIIARVEELRDEIQTQQDIIDDPETDAEDMQEAKDMLGGLDDERAELAQLESILDDLRGNGGDEQWNGDWYPVTLISESYFERAMDEMLEDCGDLPKDLPCYLRITVDYDALKMDYSNVDIGDSTYWYR